MARRERLLRQIQIVPLALGSLLAVMVACTEAPTSTPKLCTPNTDVFCRCANRNSGTKTCNADGMDFTECTCGPGGDDGVSNQQKSATPPPGVSPPNQSGSTTPSPPDPSPTPPPATTHPGSSGGPDASVAQDSGPPPIGALCTELIKCCDQLKEAGYNDDECRATVQARVEDTCFSTHMKHKDFGDCT
jgi:hypothetical protein